MNFKNLSTIFLKHTFGFLPIRNTSTNSSFLMKTCERSWDFWGISKQKIPKIGGFVFVLRELAVSVDVCIQIV